MNGNSTREDKRSRLVVKIRDAKFFLVVPKCPKAFLSVGGVISLLNRCCGAASLIAPKHATFARNYAVIRGDFSPERIPVVSPEENSLIRAY